MLFACLFLCSLVRSFVCLFVAHSEVKVKCLLIDCEYPKWRTIKAWFMSHLSIANCSTYPIHISNCLSYFNITKFFWHNFNKNIYIYINNFVSRYPYFSQSFDLLTTATRRPCTTPDPKPTRIAITPPLPEEETRRGAQNSGVYPKRFPSSGSALCR